MNQARACTVLNGKTSHIHYPAEAFWAWNDAAQLQPVRMNVKNRRAVYPVGYPSVFQTSEALRFDLVERPSAVVRSRPKKLGIGHTVHASKMMVVNVI